MEDSVQRDGLTYVLDLHEPVPASLLAWCHECGAPIVSAACYELAEWPLGVQVNGIQHFWIVTPCGHESGWTVKVAPLGCRELVF